MKPARYSFILALFALAWALPVPSWATEQADVTASLNALPLLINKITGDTVVAVIYDPANTASVTDAHNIEKIIESGTIHSPTGGKLSVLLVGTDDLSKLSRTSIAFLTPGLEHFFENINTYTSAASILTISTDIECVKKGKCIIGVSTKPSTTIYYSKAAADAAKIEFSQSFTMIVKQF